MNTVTPIDSGDPRLTAYVLGELTVAEAHAVEAWLIKSPEARVEVQGIREMVEMIRGGFGAELAASLAAPVREVPAFSVVRSPVRDLAANQKVRQRALRRFAAYGAGLAAAAAVTFAVVAPDGLEPRNAPQTVAAELPPFSGSIPGLDHLGHGADGIYLASAGGLTPDLRTRPLASDPVITEVRFLSDDPSELQNFPLTPEMVSYLPAPRAASAKPSGARSIYLDADRYPNPEIVQEEAVSPWDDHRFIPGVAVSQTSLNGPTAQAVQLKESGRELFLAGEYEAASVVFEKAIAALSDTPDDLQVRTQIEALLNASRDMAAAGR